MKVEKSVEKPVEVPEEEAEAEDEVEVEEDVAEEQEEGGEDEIELTQIKIGKKDYLIDEEFNLYDVKTQEAVGKYDQKNKKILPL